MERKKAEHGEGVDFTMYVTSIVQVLISYMQFIKRMHPMKVSTFGNFNSYTLNALHLLLHIVNYSLKVNSTHVFIHSSRWCRHSTGNVMAHGIFLIFLVGQLHVLLLLLSWSMVMDMNKEGP